MGIFSGWWSWLVTNINWIIKSLFHHLRTELPSKIKKGKKICSFFSSLEVEGRKKKRELFLRLFLFQLCANVNRHFVLKKNNFFYFKRWLVSSVFNSWNIRNFRCDTEELFFSRIIFWNFIIFLCWCSVALLFSILRSFCALARSISLFIKFFMFFFEKNDFSFFLVEMKNKFWNFQAKFYLRKFFLKFNWFRFFFLFQSTLCHM